MEKIVPLLIGNQIRTKSKEIKGIWIKLANIPGALAEVTSTFAKYDINILAINFSSLVEKGSFGTLFIIADFTDADLRDFLDKLKTLKIVENLEIVEPQFRDFLVDLYHFPITDEEGRRLLIFTEYNMESLVVRLREHFGNGGLAFLYHQGVLTGLELAEIYKKWNISDVKDALYVNFLRAQALGRYKAEIYSYVREEKSIRIQIKAYDMWECVTAKRFGINRLSCYFEKGVMTGIVEGYIEKNVKVEEVKCIAKGDKYCLFIINAKL